VRIVNFRLVAILMLATALISGAAYGIHGYQVTRKADVLLREAGFAKERGEWGQAIDYLDRYIQLVREKDVARLADLGHLQADRGRMNPAYRTLENVLRRDPSRDDDRRRLVEIALAIRRYPDALHHLEILLQQSPDDVALLPLKSQALVGMKEYAAAAEPLQKAIEKGCENLEVYAQLATLLQGRLKAPMQALEVLNQMVDEHVAAPRAYVIRGEFLMKHRNAMLAGELAKSQTTDDGTADTSAAETAPETTPDEKEPNERKPLDPKADPLEAALADARHALELAPDDEVVIAFGVRCLLANDKQEEAGELARRGLTLYRENASMYAALADVELKARRREEAVSWLSRGLEAVPDDHDLLWNISNLLIEENQIASAEKYLEMLRTTGYAKSSIAYLEARILVQQGDWFEASRRLEAIRAALAEWPDISKQADLLLGQCYEQLGRIDLELTALRRAAAVDSHWIPARLGIANGLLANGQIDEALNEYRQIAVLPGAPASVLAQLIRLEILMNLRLKPSEQIWDHASQLLDRLAEIDPEAPAVPILRAEILVARGEDEEARELLTAARDESPKTLEFWLELAALAERDDDATRAAELLDEAKAAIGDSVTIRLTQARQLVNRRGMDAREAIRELAKGIEAFTENERIALASGLAGIALAVRDYDETERLCLAIAREQPTNLRVRVLLFDLALIAEKSEAMERALDEVQKIEHSGPLWHYGEAVRLTILARQDKKPELYARAREHLSSARIARPAWSRIPQLLGVINDAQGAEEEAISNFKEAITLGTRDPNVVSRLIGLLYQRRRFSDADLMIRRLQEQQTPFSNQMMQLATDISLKLNDNERALNLAMKAAGTSKDPADHIWVGRVLSALGQAAEAEKNFRQAIVLDETSAAAWVALIQHLGRTVQTEKIETALAEAERKIKSEEVPLAIAEALESIGRFEDAEARYKALLAAAPDEIAVNRRLADFYFRQRKYADAEPLLTRMLESKAALTDEDRLRFRRNLAVALLARNDPTSRKQAEKLIDENLALNPKSVIDQRTKAMLLALLPDRASRLAAVESLEKTLSDQFAATDEGKAEARFVLASLYVDLKDVSKATSHLRKLMASNGDELRYLTFYVRYLVELNEIAEAELWQHQLQKLFPQKFTTLELATDIACAREQYEDILRSIDSYLSNLRGSEAERQDRSRRAASLLEVRAERLKRTAGEKPDRAAAAQEWAPRFLARAETLYRALTENAPQTSLALATFLGRNGRHAESLELLEKEAPTARPEEIAAVVLTLLTSSVATKEDRLRAEQVLDQALNQHHRPLVLLLAYADLQNWREKYDDAERLYREVLDKDNQNAAALNNLALLLALRGRGNPESMRLIEKALQLVGEHPSLLDSRATINLTLGQPQKAEVDLARVLEKRPTAAAYFRQAQVELRLGKREPAREALGKALTLGLKAEDLHPLERPGFRQLEAELRQ
jgi:predicted Zn-dependent protease